MTNEQLELKIEDYLAQLTDVLKGQNKALIQDVLYDSEEHIRSALAEQADVSFEQIIENWGSPVEVAKQYIDMESSVTFAFQGEEQKVELKSPVQWVLSSLSSAASYQALLYILLAIPLSLFYVFWLVLGASSAIASVMLVGIPVLIIFMRTLPYISLFEGRLIEFFLNERMPRRLSHVPVSKEQSKLGLMGLLKQEILNVNKLRIVLYLFLFFPLSILYLSSVFVPVLFSVGLILSPIVDPLLHLWNPDFKVDIDWYWLPVSLPVGLCLLSLSLLWTKWVAKGHASLAKSLLIPFKG